MPNLINLPSHDEDGQLQVVVEALEAHERSSSMIRRTDLSSSRARCAWALPIRTTGICTGTRAEDGDPMDAIGLSRHADVSRGDHPSKAIGWSASSKKEKGEKWERNDRLIVVPSDEKRWDDATALEKRAIRNWNNLRHRRDDDGEESPPRRLGRTKGSQGLIQKAVKAYDRGKK